MGIVLNHSLSNHAFTVFHISSGLNASIEYKVLKTAPLGFPHYRYSGHDRVYPNLRV
jgi:hypothetical protein